MLQFKEVQWRRLGARSTQQEAQVSVTLASDPHGGGFVGCEAEMSIKVEVIGELWVC